MDTILFDLGSTYSYVSIKFSLRLDLIFDILNYHVYVSTQIGDSMVVPYMYCAYSILSIDF